MRRFVLALFAALLVAAPPAQSATLTVITVVGVDEIVDLGVGVTPTGGASLDTTGPLPILSIPQTSVSPDGNVIEHTGSGVFVTIPGLPGGGIGEDFVIDLAAATLSATISAPGLLEPTVLVVSDILPGGSLAVSAELAALFAEAGLTVRTEGFVWGTVAFAEVPAPPALALLLAGLAGFAAVRRRALLPA
jgi:hypothetical protein